MGITSRWSHNPSLLARLGAVAVAAGLLALTTGAAQALEDDAIAAAVDGRLSADPGVPAEHVDVSADQGVVSLFGEVDNLRARQRAERLAGTVKGVRAIVNRIELDPPELSDEALLIELEAALNADPATESYPLEVDVENQVVTLSGTVASWAERRLAAAVAGGVKGVAGLVDRIQVKPEEERPDPEIDEEIEGMLAWDVLVDDDRLSVTVDDGVVRLEGFVASLAEKRRAREQAHVAGVEAVDAEGLQVADWAREPRYREEKYARLDAPDPAVAEAVRAALARDPRVPPGAVSVQVEEGTATLTGTVDNVLSKRAAGRDADNTLGVHRVVNRIKVRPGTPTDRELKQRIDAALERDPQVDAGDVEVRVNNGIVRLRGTVDSLYQKAVADNAAAGIYGVVRVNNLLEVADAESYLDYSPYADWQAPNPALQRPNRPRPPGTTAKSDWELIADVKDALYWSPYINETQVTVAADDGTVILTGTVDTWSEWRAATRSAYRGGAARVDNDLRVRRGPDYYAPEGKDTTDGSS